MTKSTDFAHVPQPPDQCCWWNVTQCVLVDELMLGDWYTGDQYRRMLTVGDTFKAIYNKTEGYKHEIIRWDHVESCYASDHWNCKYKTDCNVTKKFRCQEDHRIAIEFDQFDVRIKKDDKDNLSCYDRLAFKFGKQSKSVFDVTSQDYDTWKLDTYVPIDFCGTPSTESNDNFFPWNWTTVDFDAVEVSFESDVWDLNEKWPADKQRHSGVSVKFRCMPGNQTSSFPYTTQFLTIDDGKPPLDYDEHRNVAVFGERIRYLWDYDQGNHFVKDRYPEYNATLKPDDDGLSIFNEEIPEFFTFYPKPKPYTEKPATTTEEAQEFRGNNDMGADIMPDKQADPINSFIPTEKPENFDNGSMTLESTIASETQKSQKPSIAKPDQSNFLRCKTFFVCLVLTLLFAF